tara:strand:+ start:815 stop:1015 length:201 start_codon:yes stop_codon:yes gene_type:complete
MAIITLTTGDVINVEENREGIQRLIYQANKINSIYIEVNKKITYFSGSYEYKQRYIMISSIVMWGD